MAASRLNTIVAIAMLALYDEFDTYWQNGGYKKISDIIFAECHIFIVSNLCRNQEITRKISQFSKSEITKTSSLLSPQSYMTAVTTEIGLEIRKSR
jgi:hypothetical protein